MTRPVPAGTPERVTRAGYALGAAAAVATVFTLTSRNDAVRLVTVPPAAVVVLLVVAVLGVLGARRGAPWAFAAAAAVSGAAGLLQLAQAGRGVNWLGGNGATAAFLGALALGFAALRYLSRPAPPETGGQDAPR